MLFLFLKVGELVLVVEIVELIIVHPEEHGALLVEVLQRGVNRLGLFLIKQALFWLQINLATHEHMVREQDVQPTRLKVLVHHLLALCLFNHLLSCFDVADVLIK